MHLFFVMVSVVIVTIMVIITVVIITVVTMVAMVTVATAAFFGNMFYIIASGVFQVVLSSFELVWAVCCVSSQSTYSSGVNSECGDVPSANMPFEARSTINWCHGFSVFYDCTCVSFNEIGYSTFQTVHGLFGRCVGWN